MCVIVVHSSLIKPLLHQATFLLLWHGFILISKAQRDRKKTRYFFWKGACHGIGKGIATELAWHSRITFQQSSYWRFCVLSRHSLCMHCPFMVCALCWRCSDIPKNTYNLRANILDDRLVCTMLLLCCRRPLNCMAMVTLCQPHRALIRMMRDGFCFEHAQSACHHSEFYAIPQCCGDACDRTARTFAFCIFLGRHRITLRTLLWVDRGFTIPTCY